MKLKIAKFDVSRIAPDATIMVVGKRRTGKSTLIRDIMRHMSTKLDFGIAMCGSEDTAQAMSEYIPPSCIYNEYNAEALDVLLKYQKRCLTMDACKKVYLIMDDTMYDKTTLKSKNMRLLFMNGRHRKIFFLCAVQYLMDIPPDLRTNVDYLFVLKENVLANKEKLHRQFFGMFNEYKDFAMVMNSCTAGFECMVLDNTARSNNPAECVFWYQGDPAGGSFNVGSQGIWNLDKQFGIPENLVGGGAHHQQQQQQPLRSKEDMAPMLVDDDDEDGKTTVGVAEKMAVEQHRKKSSGASAGEMALAMLMGQQQTGIHAVEKCGVIRV